MKNKKNKESKEDLTTGDRLGIKGLSKGKRRKLEAYQHLFYLLQVKQKICLNYNVHLALKVYSKCMYKIFIRTHFLSFPFRPIHTTWPN